MRILRMVLNGGNPKNHAPEAYCYKKAHATII